MARLLVVEDSAELAELVASAARARGHLPVELHSGKEALASLQQQPPDAAIVDLQLADIRGTEVLSALQQQKVPAFVISGAYRGDRFAKEAMERHGARAFFEKPFELEALFRAIEQVTGPAAQAQAQAPASAGKLKPGSIARLLNAYYQARHTGELKLRQSPVMKVVFFEGGQPVYAASNLAAERFARFCTRRGVLPEAELAAVAALAKESSLRTGEAMIQLGLISAEQRRRLLEDQIKEIIWSTFGWSEGEYAFSPRRPQRVDLVKLSVFPGDLILEGARREPLVVLRRKMPADRKLFPAPEPPYQLHEIHLDAADAHLLVWADGSKSTDDLLALADRNEREVLGTLYGFELLGLLEERRDAGKSRISFGL